VFAGHKPLEDREAGRAYAGFFEKQISATICPSTRSGDDLELEKLKQIAREEFELVRVWPAAAGVGNLFEVEHVVSVGA